MLKLFSKEIQIVAVTVVVFLTHQLAIEKTEKRQEPKHFSVWWYRRVFGPKFKEPGLNLAEKGFY